MRPPKTYIFSSYFTKKKHPQSIDPTCIGIGKNGRVPQDDFGYIQKWADSLKKPYYKPVLFHDGVSGDFQDKFPHIQFELADGSYDAYSLNDARFLYYSDFLHDKEDVDCASIIFMTDASDVVITGDPLLLTHREKGHVFYTGGENKKLVDYNCSFGGSYQDAHNAFGFDGNPLQIREFPLINMGVLGGFSDKVCNFLREFKKKRIDIGYTSYNMNMPLGNNILRNLYEDRILVGDPVTSAYKGFENKREDVYFIHK